MYNIFIIPAWQIFSHWGKNDKIKKQQEISQPTSSLIFYLRAQHAIQINKQIANKFFASASFSIHLSIFLGWLPKCCGGV